MKPITDKSQITQTDLDNLNSLRELYDYYDSLIPFSKSINKLFYMYIQTCLHNNEDIMLDQGDVYNVLEAIKFLETLKENKPELDSTISH